MSSPLSGKDTIDRVLLYCQCYGLHTVADADLPPPCRDGTGRPRTVRIGNIAFRCNGHSTGNDVRGWIIDGDDAYEFVNTTYWFSSSYTFNESRWERGAWDGAVEELFATLRASKEKHEVAARELQERVAAERAKAETDVKARFERQFM